VGSLGGKKRLEREWAATGKVGSTREKADKPQKEESKGGGKLLKEKVSTRWGRTSEETERIFFGWKEKKRREKERNEKIKKGSFVHGIRGLFIIDRREEEEDHFGGKEKCLRSGN